MSSSSSFASEASDKATIRESGSILANDEAELLEVYRRAKRLGYADIAVTIQEGTRVKLWLTEKLR